MFVFVIPILATRVKRKNAWASWKNYQKLYHLEENVHVFRELEVRFSLLWPKWVLQQQHIYLSGWKISLNKCLPLLLWIYLQELGEIILIILTSFSWFIFMRSFLKQRSCYNPCADLWAQIKDPLYLSHVLIQAVAQVLLLIPVNVI